VTLTGDGDERLGQGSDLIQLDPHGVGDAVHDGGSDQHWIGHQVVVADELDAAAERVGDQALARVTLRQR
jgi:hypothetical protein